jgi:hypothetical protein
MVTRIRGKDEMVHRRGKFLHKHLAVGIFPSYTLFAWELFPRKATKTFSSTGFTQEHFMALFKTSTRVGTLTASTAMACLMAATMTLGASIAMAKDGGGGSGRSGSTGGTGGMSSGNSSSSSSGQSGHSESSSAGGRSRSSDDGAGHTRQGQGTDDATGHIRQSQGADDAPGHIRQSQGADDIVVQ